MRGHSRSRLLLYSAGQGCFPSNVLPAGRGNGASSARSALCRSCGYLSNCDLYARSDSFALTWAKESRRTGGWFPKEGTVGPFLGWRSLGTFLSPWTERCKHKQTDKLQFHHLILPYYTPLLRICQRVRGRRRGDIFLFVYVFTISSYEVYKNPVK